MGDIPKREFCPPSEAYMADISRFTWEGVAYFYDQWNTYYHTCAQGNGSLDYFSINYGPDDSHPFPLHHPDLSEVKNRLLLNGYPHYHDELPDELTMVIYHGFVERGWDSRLHP